MKITGRAYILSWNGLDFDGNSDFLAMFFLTVFFTI